VAKLEAVAAGRQLLQRAGQHVVVALEATRKLPDDRAQAARLDQRLDALEVAGYPVSHVAQPLHVCEVLAGLGGEDEVLGGLIHPPRDALA
jgi:hypothetical protein